MTTLLRLPLRAVGIATAPTRFAVKTILRFLRDDGAHAAEGGWSAETPPSEAPAPHYEQRAAAAARARRKPPEPVKRRQVAKPSPKAARRAVRHEPTKGEAAA